MTSFKSQLRAFEEKTVRKFDLLLRKVSLDAFSEVIDMSPVDSGRFRGNWQVAIGSVPSGTIEAVDPQGAVVKAKVAGVTAGLKTGDVIYMVNNLPYARRLEDGYSQQAPAGMVRLTVQRWQPIVDAAVKQIVSAG